MNTTKAAVKAHAQTFMDAMRSELGDDTTIVIVVGDDRGRTFFLSNLDEGAEALLDRLVQQVASLQGEAEP